MKFVNKFKIILIILFITKTPALGQVSHSINFSERDLIVSETKGFDQITYTTVLYNEFQKVRKPGSPELPVKYINLIIPSNQKVKGLKLASRERGCFFGK